MCFTLTTLICGHRKVLRTQSPRPPLGRWLVSCILSAKKFNFNHKCSKCALPWIIAVNNWLTTKLVTRSVMTFSPDWWTCFIHHPAVGHASLFHSARSLSLTRDPGAAPPQLWLIVNQRATKSSVVNGIRLSEMIYQTSPCWTLLRGRSGLLG